jgi:hypothetical protein
MNRLGLGKPVIVAMLSPVMVKTMIPYPWQRGLVGQVGG